MNKAPVITHQTTSWESQSRAKIDLVLHEIMAWGAALGRDGQLPPMPAQAGLLQELYQQALPLARLMDHAQLALHAEGPGANTDAPWLAALKWMTDTTQRVLRLLAVSWLEAREADGRALSKRIDWRIAGMAPGGLWLGIRAEAPDGDLLPRDADLMKQMGNMLGQLPLAGRFIDDEGLRPGVHEAFDDPAQLDVALEGLKHLAPTGKAGIHTLALSSREHGQVTVSQRERVVISEVLRRPKTSKTREAEFVGEIRLVDLDKSRATLRTKTDGAIRCAIDGMQLDQVRGILGSAVYVRGIVESDRHGRPRMLYVSDMRPAPKQEQIPT